MMKRQPRPALWQRGSVKTFPQKPPSSPAFLLHWAKIHCAVEFIQCTPFHSAPLILAGLWWGLSELREGKGVGGCGDSSKQAHKI